MSLYQGVLCLNHISDEILKDAVPEVIIVRPTYFFEDFAPFLDAAKEDNPTIYSWITPIDYKFPMVSNQFRVKTKKINTDITHQVGLKDIASSCVNSLLSSPAKPSPHYYKLFGPRAYGANDPKEAVEEITGKKVELKLVEKDQLLDYWKQIVPEAHAEEFKEMTVAGLGDGIIGKDIKYDENTVVGEQGLVDALRALYKK